MSDDARWLTAAAALAARARPLSNPNPGVAAIIVKDGIVIARGWTQPDGRPHAEAVAIAQAGNRAKGATLYVTLEPCAHKSARGPSCADLICSSGLTRVVVGCMDPDPRTSGAGISRIQQAGIPANFVHSSDCVQSLSGYLTVKYKERPEVTLKLALSLDGCIALHNGESKWITGPEARAHTHAMRARSDAILVGGGTVRADNPKLDVRLPGLEGRSPQRWALTRGKAPDGWHTLAAPEAISSMNGILHLFVEGGAQTASAFLAAGLVDRVLIYRAPILIGGRHALNNYGLTKLANAHNKWRVVERRQLGDDTLEVYDTRNFTAKFQ